MINCIRSERYYLKYLPATNWQITLNVKDPAGDRNGTFPLSENR